MLASCRAHPIRTAALLGAILGLLQTLTAEIGGVLHRNQHAVLLLLAPFSRFGAVPTEQNILRTTAILLIEFAANILVDALLLAAPVAVIVLLLRMMRRRSNNPLT